MTKVEEPGLVFNKRQIFLYLGELLHVFFGDGWLHLDVDMMHFLIRLQLFTIFMKTGLVDLFNFKPRLVSPLQYIAHLY